MPNDLTVALANKLVETPVSGALALLRPWLGGNDIFIPGGVPEELLEHIPQALEAAQERLIESAPKTIAVVLDEVFEALGCEIPSTRALELYIEALVSMPPDLLVIAGKRVIQRYKWPSTPKPGDFLNMIDHELQGRKQVLTSLQILRDRKALAEKVGGL
jgi:hypothetical protein